MVRINSYFAPVVGIKFWFLLCSSILPETVPIFPLLFYVALVKWFNTIDFPSIGTSSNLVCDTVKKGFVFVKFIYLYNINFSESGWRLKLGEIFNWTPQYAGMFVKKYMSETWDTCFKHIDRL